MQENTTSTDIYHLFNMNLDDIPPGARREDRNSYVPLPVLTKGDYVWYEYIQNHKDALQAFEALENAPDIEKQKFIVHLKDNDMEARFMLELRFCASC